MLGYPVQSNFYISSNILSYISYLVGNAIHIDYIIWICQFISYQVIIFHNNSVNKVYGGS